MGALDLLDLKPFLPAKDFEQSKEFYQDLGFTLCWGEEGDLAYLHWGDQWMPGVRAEPPEDRPWNLRDMILNDPSGVLWRIAQEIPAPTT